MTTAPARQTPDPSPPPLAARLKESLRRRRRLLLTLAVGAIALMVVRGTMSGASGDTLDDALATVAARSGLKVDRSSILWLEPAAGPLTLRPVLFLGREGDGALSDLWYAEVRQGGEATALDVAWMSNLSRTASAEEGPPLRMGDHVAYASRVAGRYDAITVVDLRGEPEALVADWPTRARWQNEVTNLQDTGRAAGFGVVRYQLVDPTEALEVTARDGRFEAALGDERLAIDPGRLEPLRGADLVEIQEQTKGMPETVPWVVDTVRNVSWVGPEPIEWLENRVFGVKDALTRAYHGVFGAPDTAEEVAEEMVMPEEVTEERIAMLTVTDPELGWPPAPIEPLIQQPAVENEGRWIPIVDDPFVNAYPNAPPAFYQTFLRSDEERPYTRVYVTIWDPRQVQLRIQSGVHEPESATGQRGTGMVPREPEVLRRLVGAFNGGFQSLHGEFGMMASSRIYLPPKPWAATVAVFDDGRVGMGSWPAPDWRGRYYDERLANRQIPEGMVDMRQNLTSVVEDGVYNPWERWYWGAAPRQVEEQTFTTRSGMCLTSEGFLAYFWSQGVGPEALGEAMNRARCVRSMHLDMNNPHCGFEFFQPFAPGVDPPPLGSHRLRRDSEYDGRFMRTDGWRLRARRAVRSMGMPFPRYSDRDGRDFFYLLLRPVLPGPHLVVEGGSEGEGVFSTNGLPHAGWPHAFARTFLGGDDTARTWIVRIDPTRAVPAPVRREDQTRALAYFAGAASIARQDAPEGIVARRHEIGWTLVDDAPAEGDRVIVSGPRLTAMPEAEAAVGLDGDGFLVYAERAGDPVPLLDRMRVAGVANAFALPAESRLAFEVGDHHAGVDGFTRVPVEAGTALAFFAEERPATEVLFPDNAPQPYRVWGFLQDQRVRYQRHSDGSPRFVRPLDQR
ncbi:MAG: hypothetical protein KC619_26900 [Myxococcales bacterium]|nr:hypothetical protein [Myxococcales bacterium]